MCVGGVNKEKVGKSNAFGESGPSIKGKKVSNCTEEFAVFVWFGYQTFFRRKYRKRERKST